MQSNAGYEDVTINSTMMRQSFIQSKYWWLCMVWCHSCGCTEFCIVTDFALLLVGRLGKKSSSSAGEVCASFVKVSHCTTHLKTLILSTSPGLWGHMASRSPVFLLADFLADATAGTFWWPAPLPAPKLHQLMLVHRPQLMPT